MEFRYFRDPVNFGVGYTSEKQQCSICSELSDGFNLWRPVSDDEIFVCSECFSNGKAAKFAKPRFDPDITTLRQQLKEINPDWEDLQIEEVAQSRTNELLFRTPGIESWQDFLWPAHCGDYCCFVKEAGKPDLCELADDNDGKSFFAEKLLKNQRESTPIDPVWNAVRPDSPKDKSIAYDVGVYLFQCLHCKEYVIHWDAN